MRRARQGGEFRSDGAFPAAAAISRRAPPTRETRPVNARIAADRAGRGAIGAALVRLADMAIRLGRGHGCSGATQHVPPGWLGLTHVLVVRLAPPPRVVVSAVNPPPSANAVCV